MTEHRRDTMLNLLIRDEREADRQEISTLIRAAFADHPHTTHTESFIVDALRRSGALTVSLVAEVAGVIVGHTALSPVSISDGSPGWHGLGPVAVIPRAQKQGIGRQLVEQGLVRLRELGSNGCVVLGDPLFYSRFGFAGDPNLTLPGVPPEYFQALRFGGEAPCGAVSYHAAFAADA